MPRNTLIVEQAPRLVCEEHPYFLVIELATVITVQQSLTSPNGTKWVPTIDNDGVVVWNPQ